MIVVSFGLLLRRAFLIHDFACGGVSAHPAMEMWVNDIIVPLVSSGGLLVFSLALYNLFNSIEGILRKLSNGNIRKSIGKRQWREKG